MPPRNGLRDRWILEHIGKHRCQCGCGSFVEPNYDRYYGRNEPGGSMRFCAGHQNRGTNHPHYGDGQIEAKGYVWILSPNHPRKTPRGYVKRCVLAMEAHLGRILQPGELVHHVDRNKQNDAIGNLEVSDRVRHGHEHSPVGPTNRGWRHDIDFARDIAPLRAEGKSSVEIAARLGCAHATVVRRTRDARGREGA